MSRDPPHPRLCLRSGFQLGSAARTVGDVQTDLSFLSTNVLVNGSWGVVRPCVGFGLHCLGTLPGLGVWLELSGTDSFHARRICTRGRRLPSQTTALAFGLAITVLAYATGHLSGTRRINHATFVLPLEIEECQHLSLRL